MAAYVPKPQGKPLAPGIDDFAGAVGRRYQPEHEGRARDGVEIQPLELEKAIVRRRLLLRLETGKSWG
jgi:hypothetical protein